ncbi:MAG: hypothetical protein WB974_12385, partial [Acidobacteriaceae bacterium]
EDLWQSDLDPARAPSGQYEGEPCIFFRYTAKDGLEPLPGRLVQSCTDLRFPLADDSAETFAVDLRLGVLIARHSDVSLPGVVPIRFERALRDGWPKPNAFGVTGIDNYDSFLTSNDNIRVTMVGDDGGDLDLERRPRWLPFLSLVRYVDADFSGRLYDMRWRTDPFPHYDLHRFDGQVETYLPCGASWVLRCYLDGVRDPEGHELKFDRDQRRQLVQLTSPDGHWVRITHGLQDRIDQVLDSSGRIVRYGYDDHDRLITVTYPSGESLHFTWDDTQHLLTFSAAPNSQTPPRLLLSNEYRDGRITRQALADGGVYTYRYDEVHGIFVRAVTIQDPNRDVYRLIVGRNSAIIREDPAAPAASR